MQALSRAGVSALTRLPARLDLCRGMAGEGLKGFKEGEKVMEDLYFNKEDERLLSKILKKVKTQTMVVDKHSAAGTLAAEKSALQEIVGKYNLPDADLEKLLAWKHTLY